MRQVRRRPVAGARRSQRPLRGAPGRRRDDAPRHDPDPPVDRTAGGAYGRPKDSAQGGGRMYPASFEYFAPETIDEALTILERFGDEGKVLAGGQSLIPLMKLRFAAPRAVVDINRIAGLDGLGEDDGRLRIGALVRHKACERSALLHGRWGTLGDAAPQISDPLVRNLGTVAGSLAHADPQGDWGSA